MNLATGNGSEQINYLRDRERRSRQYVPLPHTPVSCSVDVACRAILDVNNGEHHVDQQRSLRVERAEQKLGRAGRPSGTLDRRRADDDEIHTESTCLLGRDHLGEILASGISRQVLAGMHRLFDTDRAFTLPDRSSGRGVHDAPDTRCCRRTNHGDRAVDVDPIHCTRITRARLVHARNVVDHVDPRHAFGQGIGVEQVTEHRHSSMVRDGAGGGFAAGERSHGDSSADESGKKMTADDSAPTGEERVSSHGREA